MKHNKNIAKNIIRKIFLTFVGSLLLATPAFAGTSVVINPGTVKTTPGQTFTLTISVDSAGVKNYAEKVELDYPADVIEVKSFTFSNDWIQLTQSGYDQTDNTNGVLIKSAGLPSGLSSLTTFGTVTFSVKKVGKQPETHYSAPNTPPNEKLGDIFSFH